MTFRAERLAYLNAKYGAVPRGEWGEDWFREHAGELRRLLDIPTTQDRVQSLVNSEGQHGANRLTLCHQEVLAPWRR